MFLNNYCIWCIIYNQVKKLRLASNMSSIFSGGIFPADVGEIRHPIFFLKWLLGPSWARLSFYKKVWMPGTSESDKFICFSSEIGFPKTSVLEVEKSKPIPKLAQDGNHENFTKKGVLE